MFIFIVCVILVFVSFYNTRYTGGGLLLIGDVPPHQLNTKLIYGYIDDKTIFNAIYAEYVTSFYPMNQFNSHPPSDITYTDFIGKHGLTMNKTFTVSIDTFNIVTILYLLRECTKKHKPVFDRVMELSNFFNSYKLCQCTDGNG